MLEYKLIISLLGWVRGNTKAFVGQKSISFDGHVHDDRYITKDSSPEPVQIRWTPLYDQSVSNALNTSSLYNSIKLLSFSDMYQYSIFAFYASDLAFVPNTSDQRTFTYQLQMSEDGTSALGNDPLINVEFRYFSNYNGPVNIMRTFSARLYNTGLRCNSSVDPSVQGINRQSDLYYMPGHMTDEANSLILFGIGNYATVLDLWLYFGSDNTLNNGTASISSKVKVYGGNYSS